MGLNVCEVPSPSSLLYIASMFGNMPLPPPPPPSSFVYTLFAILVRRELSRLVAYNQLSRAIAKENVTPVVASSRCR